MTSKTFNKENLASATWEDDYFIYCYFEEFEMEGGPITSEFIDCSLSKLDWYWGLFNNMNFINCRFTDCVFRGTASRAVSSNVSSSIVASSKTISIPNATLQIASPTAASLSEAKDSQPNP